MAHQDTGSPHLLSVLSDGVLTLTLNRPEASNALTYDLLEALRLEIRYAELSAEVRCILLQGSGAAFCAGGDIRLMSKRPPGAVSIDDHIRWQQSMQRDLCGRLAKMPKPTVAIVNGPAAGAGLSLALSCDLRLMAKPAFFMTAFANVGLSGDFGCAYFLSRLIGSAKARELMFLSDRISAAEALDLGLINWCCEIEDLAERARLIAARLATGPLTAVGYMKDNLNRAVTGGMDDCMDVEASHHIRCMTTAEHLEGVSAFAAKRRPDFARHAQD